MSAVHGPASTTEQRLAERYGRTGRRSVGRRAALAALVLALAALAAWWIWVAVVRSSPDVTWQVVGFDAVTDDSVEVRWVVDRDPQTPVDCVLRARDASGEEVGRDRVSVAVGGSRSVDLRATIKTSARPVAGEVLSCLPVSG